MAKELEGAPKKIRIQERAKVADVGHVINRWSARVERDGSRRVPRPQVVRSFGSANYEASASWGGPKVIVEKGWDTTKQPDGKSISKSLYEEQLICRLLATLCRTGIRVVSIPNGMQFHCNQIVVRTNKPTEVEPNIPTQEAQSKNVHVNKAKNPWRRHPTKKFPFGPATSSCRRFDHA